MALPSKPSMLGDQDSAASQEYYAALQKTLDALDARANKGPNWFQIAGAFLDPGKTGNFGESLGNVGKVMGAQQEQKQAQMLPIAQMRAEISGQKYQMQNQAKAMGILASAMGTTTDVATKALADGSVPPAAASRITPQLYAQVARLSPQVGELVSKLFGMQNEATKVDLQGRQFNLDVEKFNAEKTQRLVTNAQADLRNGMDVATLKAKYGDEILGMIPNYVQPGGGQKTPAPAPASAPALMAPPPMAPAPAPSMISAPNPDMGGAPGLKAPAMLMPAPPSTPAMGPAASASPSIPEMRAALAANTGTAPTPTSVGSTATSANTASLPLEARIGANRATVEAQSKSDIEVAQKRTVARDDEWKDKRSGILTFDPSTTSAQTRDLKELYDIANKKPQIFGILQKEGAIAAMKAAAQEGVTTPWGSFSLPAKTMEEKYRLSEEDQRDLSIAQKILGRQFFENAKTNKSVLGPQISNADVMLLKAPLITDQDSAEAIKYWVKQNVLANKQKDELYKNLTAFDQKYGSRVPMSQFFTGPEYKAIFDRYDNLFRELTRTHSPVFSSPSR